MPTQLWPIIREPWYQDILLRLLIAGDWTDAMQPLKWWAEVGVGMHTDDVDDSLDLDSLAEPFDFLHDQPAEAQPESRSSSLPSFIHRLFCPRDHYHASNAVACLVDGMITFLAQVCLLEVCIRA